MRVLRAAKKAVVRQVVLTSSALAMFGSMKTGTFGPNDWTNVRMPNISTYTKSKTLAEQSAWGFIEAQSGKNAMEMVSINPGGMFGPSLGRNNHRPNHGPSGSDVA